MYTKYALSHLVAGVAAGGGELVSRARIDIPARAHTGHARDEREPRGFFRQRGKGVRGAGSGILCGFFY